MPERLLRTGVVLRLPSSHPRDEALPFSPPTPDRIDVEVQVFAELQHEGRTHRIGGSFDGGTLDRTADPTALISLAQTAREIHLGDLFGDVRIGGCDVTRFEFYAAPFRIELSGELNDEFATVWERRAPTPTCCS